MYNFDAWCRFSPAKSLLKKKKAVPDIILNTILSHAVMQGNWHKSTQLENIQHLFGVAFSNLFFLGLFFSLVDLPAR